MLRSINNICLRVNRLKINYTSQIFCSNKPKNFYQDDTLKTLKYPILPHSRFYREVYDNSRNSDFKISMYHFNYLISL